MIIFFMLLLGGCATHSSRVNAPLSLPKPTNTGTEVLDNNIKELEKNLGRASSRTERINILVDAIQ